MKEHTPIKRHQAIVSFSKDHHFGLLLVWKIRQGLKNAVNAERISSYLLYFFKEDLEKHFKEEEEFLFSKLPVDDDLRILIEVLSHNPDKDDYQHQYKNRSFNQA